MDITTLSEQELKALLYDQFVQQEQTATNIRLLQEQLAKLTTAEASSEDKD